MTKKRTMNPKPVAELEVTAPRRSDEVMRNLVAAFGAAEGVSTLSFAPPQELSTLESLATLVAPRFNGWRAAGLSTVAPENTPGQRSPATTAAEQLVERFEGLEAIAPRELINALSKGEMGTAIDFPVYVFDMAWGLRRSFVISRRLEFLTQAHLLKQLKAVHSNLAEIAEISSGKGYGRWEDITASVGLSTAATVAETKAALKEAFEALVVALYNFGAGLRYDLTQQAPADLAFQVLDWVSGERGPVPNGIFVMLDMHEPLEFSVVCQRRLKALASSLRKTQRRLIIAGSKTDFLPRWAAHGVIPHYTIELPDQAEIKWRIAQQLSQTTAALERRDRIVENRLTPSDLRRLEVAARGLTAEEISGAIVKAVVGPAVAQSIGSDDGEEKPPVVIGPHLIEALTSVKVQKLNSLGVKFTPAGEIKAGGMLGLKTRLDKFKRLFFLAENPTPASEALGVIHPKGMIVFGVSGTGKSLIVKQVAEDWELPCIQINVSALFGSLLGETGERFRLMQETVNSCAPGIVFIDEIDKAFAGMGQGGDGGTSARLMGDFLTWLQEHPPGLFFVATANNLLELQAKYPELLRKGRFDEIVFVDVPTLDERKDILAIHLAKRNTTLGNGDLTTAAQAMAHMTGAEIAEVVNNATHPALDASRDHIILDDLLEVAAEVAPSSLAPANATTINALREWAATNAIPANGEKSARRTPTPIHPEMMGDTSDGLNL